MAREIMAMAHPDLGEFPGANSESSQLGRATAGTIGLISQRPRDVSGPGPVSVERDVIEFPKRVLLVEPVASERWWLRHELLAGHMEVFEAGDLITALRSTRIFEPSLILSQLRLPVHGGLELVRQIKDDGSTRSMPILLYAEMATAEERIRAFELGAGDFICKPFVGAELLARVRRTLRTRQLLSILERRAHLDGLTGLANRGVLEARLPRECEEAGRRKTPLAVMICDLDHFKSINDTFGHASGDEVLRQAAACLADCVRSSDLVARYGGEEFVVVAPDCGLEPALRLADRFRLAIRDLQIVENGTTIPLSVSVGVAVLNGEQSGKTGQILRKADESLYRAKETGRNAVWYWDSERNAPSPSAERLKILPGQ